MKNLKNHEKEELKRKAFQLYEDGSSYQDIATELGIGKTTAYNWITYDYPKYDVRTVHGTNSDQPNGIPNDNTEIGELNDLRKDLEEEYGTDKDIAILANLRTEQMANEIQQEKLELERQEMLHSQSMEQQQINSEQLKEKLNKTETKLTKAERQTEQLSNDNSELSELNRNLSKENDELNETIDDLVNEKEEIELIEDIELDENLKVEVTTIISDFLAIEDTVCTVDYINDLIDNIEPVAKRIGKFIKKQNLNKADSPERSTLKEIIKTLNEMLNDFEEADEEELTFTFDSDFEKELKENHPDLVIQPQVDNDERIELDEDLLNEYTDRVKEFIDLEDEKSTIDEINNLIESTEDTIEKIGEWYRNQDFNESDSEEFSKLNTIIEILNDLLVDFNESDEEELTITLDSDFERELKENHLDLVKSQNNNAPKKRRRRRRRV